MESSWVLALCGTAGVPEDIPGEAFGKSAAQSQCRPRILVMPVPWINHQGQQHPWRRAGLSLGNTFCMLWQTIWCLKHHESQMSSTDVFTSLNFGGCIDLMWHTWFLLCRVRPYIFCLYITYTYILFVFYRIPQLWNFWHFTEILERPWNFGKTLEF